MTKRLVIAGAGGFGRGVYEWVQQSPVHRQKHGIDKTVFIDDNPDKVHPKEAVLGTLHNYQPAENDEVLVAVGSPRLRREIVYDLAAKGVQFHTFVDDRAILAQNVQLAPGTIICPGTVISANAKIGSHVHINFNCSIGHDVTIGDLTTLSPMSNVMGETVVGSHVFLGGSAVVLPRITIGDWVVVGAGSTLVNEVKDVSTVMGNPAR